MCRSLGRTECTEPGDTADQFGRGRRLGETKVANLAPTKGDRTARTGLVRSVTHHPPWGKANPSPFSLEAHDVLARIDSTDPKLHEELQGVRYVLRCGGAHTASPFPTSGKVDRILYTRITAHRVLLSAECFFESILSIVVSKMQKRKPASFEAGFSIHRPVYRISYVIVTDAEMRFSPGVRVGATGAAPLSIAISAFAYIG